MMSYFTKIFFIDCIIMVSESEFVEFKGHIPILTLSPKSVAGSDSRFTHQ